MYVRVAFLLVTVLCAGACGDNNTGLTTSTTPTSTATTTETFGADQTLTVNGAVTHQFSTTGRGTVTATLTAVSPNSATVIGLSLGTWNGSSCQIVLANDQTAQGDGLIGQVSGVGNLCLRVYDPGKLTAPVTYSVDVSHP
jgi:hypothetical protein